MGARHTQRQGKAVERCDIGLDMIISVNLCIVFNSSSHLSYINGCLYMFILLLNIDYFKIFNSFFTHGCNLPRYRYMCVIRVLIELSNCLLCINYRAGLLGED